MGKGNHAGHQKGNDDSPLRGRVAGSRQQEQPTEECRGNTERGPQKMWDSMTVGRSCVEKMLTMIDVAISMSGPPSQPVKCQSAPTAAMAVAARNPARPDSCQSRWRMNVVLAGRSVLGVVESHSSITR